jgi:hypothetical protein
VLDRIAALATEVDALRSGLRGHSDDELDMLVPAVAALRERVEAAWLDAVALADERALHRRHAERDTAAWLASVAGERRGAARRDVELASALAAAPVVASSVGDGVSRAKAAELVQAALLPDEVQADLVSFAKEAAVEQVATAVRRARLDHGLPEPVVEPSATLTRRADRVVLDATVDLVDGEVLEVALDTMAEQLGLPTDVPYPQRRAKALVGLAKHYLDHATDLPTSRIGRPHVVALVALETLEARTGGSAVLGSGAVISGDEARRLASDANVCRVITSGRSMPLDVGRTTRSAPPHLAKAVWARDRHCRYEGCTAPPWACEIHHLIPWVRSGPTALTNLGLVCWHHHGEIHRRGAHLLRATAAGRWTLRPVEVAA